MEMNLRPLTLGEILDRTAQLYRENFLLFAGISAVYAGVLLVMSLLQIGLQEALRAAHMAHQLLWLMWTLSGASMLMAFIFAGAAVAANNRAVGWVHLGEPATIHAAYSSILPRLGRYLWLMTIAAVMVWLPIMLLYIAYFGTVFVFARAKGQTGLVVAPQDSHSMMILLIASIVFALLLIPAIAYTIVMGLRYSLAVPACVVENLKAREAIRRSIQLSKGSRGRIFLLGLLALSVQIGLILVTQLFFIIAGYKHHGVLPAGMRALQQVVAFFTNSFVGPIYATGLTLFYYDQRVRKEGYDIEWMMRSAGMTNPIPAPESEAAPAPETPPELPPAAEPEPESAHE
jgi:hypothetical protein